MLTLPAIKHEIKKCLSNEPSIAHIIIFGSYVNNSVHEDSDIDLVVILKEKGIDSCFCQLNSVPPCQSKSVPLFSLILNRFSFRRLLSMNGFMFPFHAIIQPVARSFKDKYPTLMH